MDQYLAFSAHGVQKRFGDFCALKNVSLNVPKGQIYGFIGRNGAGKTTFMRIVCGLMQPSEGFIHMDGRLSFLPQNVRFRDRMSGEEALCFFAKLRRGDAKESKHLAAQLEIDLKKPVSSMSPGQQRKLQLVIAAVGSPEILVLDEPTAGLDPTGVQQVRAILQLMHQAGKTVFLSSHVLMELENLCDTVAMIDKGELLYQGPCCTTYEIETGGVDEEITKRLNRGRGERFRLSGDRLLAQVEHEEIPAVLEALYAQNVRVFGVRRQGIESLYNALVQEGA
jgi:ABC-2 type transport system ATP-binding protein